MMVIRPIRESDHEAFERFATTAGFGVTSLPRNHKLLMEKIHRSVASFASPDPGGDGLYVFVLEDVEEGTLAGTCSIEAKTQGSEDGFLYRVEDILVPRCHFPTPKTIRILQPIQRKNFASEIGGLYLLPKYRAGGLGRLLSLSRFLFMAAFPERLHATVFAEMRGRIDKEGNSPFWDAVGHHFLKLPFPRLLAELTNDHSLIPRIMPQFPLYVSMLPEAAQRAIGRTHKNTRAAFNMLISEGFQPTGEVDILAAGPKLAAQISQIRTVVNSRKAIIKTVEQELTSGARAMISNEHIHFRVSYGTLIEHSDEGSVSVHRDLAALLQVREGDVIRYLLAPPRQAS